MTSFTIIQIPSNENDFTAIVQATTSFDNTVITDFGVATSSIQRTENPEILLCLAKEKAVEQIEKQGSRATTQSDQNQASTLEIKAKENPPKKKYNHDPNKKISTGQINYIITLAGNEEYVNDLCRERYNSSLLELNSKQAHEIIDSFK